MTIDRLLVANRGEIARRVFRTCRSLGIGTVAVFSDADAGLRFVAEADAAVRLPGSTLAGTYLHGDLIVDAARRTGADAVHPGYGFLSESADFARQVMAAGLTWVGPPPEAIEAMGSKVEAKKLVAKVGVPVLRALAAGEVTAADLPLLVKASAGGGGRGMRVVRTLDELAGAVEAASTEAASAFGDATVFCEPFVEHGRHLEVQVVADTAGNLMLLAERDCSLQRRHQKLVEETPAPGISSETRKALREAARLAATSVRYVGAGTVEFLLDPVTGRFWFLEMNTRLQVEHPITECVTGLDLVALQLGVAEGRSLQELGPAEAQPRGHAVEARLYAEDPARNWQPQSGWLTRFDVPDVAAEFSRPPSYGIRLDAGYQAGDEVGTHYDAMLAKVVAWAPTREQALRRLADTVARTRVHGPGTNRDLLVNVLRHPDFVAGEVSTDFLDVHGLEALARPHRGPDAVALSGFAATVVLAERAKAARRVQPGVPAGWRNVTSQPQLTRFVCEGQEVDVRWYGGRRGYHLADADASVADLSGLCVAIATHGPDKSAVHRRFEVDVTGDRVDVDSSLGHVVLTRVPRFEDPATQVVVGSLLAPMPGTVVQVLVAAGDAVVAGQPLLVLEAMKMQHTVPAPHAGVVRDLPVGMGDQVAAGTVLAVVQDEDAAGRAPEGDRA